MAKRFGRAGWLVKHDALLVVSYYDRRPIEPLWRLFQSIRSFDAGRPIDVCVVINRTGNHELAIPKDASIIGIVERENLGMNIGAWDAGWRRFRQYKSYIFLQDECYPIRDGWANSLISVTEQSQVGLVGESINLSWNKDWDVLREIQSKTVMPEHCVNGQPANRVDAYLDFFKRNGIPKGVSGRHLRALVWAIRRSVLEEIGGFPIGSNYGECIAAEIGTSKKIEALNLEVRQIGDQPFSFVRHQEWNQDRPGGPFVHSPPPAQLFSVPPWASKSMTSELPAWSSIARLVAMRLRNSVTRWTR